MKNILTVAGISFVLSSALCLTADAARPKKHMHKAPPDLTAAGKQDDGHDWSLGAIGANGIFS